MRPTSVEKPFTQPSRRYSHPRDPGHSKHTRAHSSLNRSKPPPILYLLITLTLLLSLAILFNDHSTDCQTEPFRLIPDLKRWSDPAFAAASLKIFIYELPPRFNTHLVKYSINHRGTIRDPRCDTNFYSSEVHVHRFLENSPVRTKDPNLADFFYVPIYATCHLITHQPNDLEMVGHDFRQAMNLIISQYPYWNRTNGRDHVYLFSQGFSARLAGDWTPYKNGIFMVHNGEFTAPEYTPHKDITIPPELRAYLKPFWLQNDGNPLPHDRKYLAQFGGQVVKASVSDHRGSNYSGGVRQYIQAHLTSRPDYRITGVRSDTYLDDMKNSKFCLAPEGTSPVILSGTVTTTWDTYRHHPMRIIRVPLFTPPATEHVQRTNTDSTHDYLLTGWHPWSPRPYYGVLMGCVPVIISEVQELAFEEFVDWDSFAVWIRPSEIANLDAILRSFSDAELERRRQAMKAIWRVFWYADDGLANQAILRSLYLRKYDSSPRRQFSSI